ncbi:MAG: DUF6310 domain-containing protein [Candidatus Thiodiazotropha endolucinida]
MMTTIEVLKKQSLSMHKQTQGKFEMGSSVIGAMRHLSPFMKSIAMAVVITFGMFVLAPAAMAARTYDWGFIADPSLSVETKLSMAVQQVEELLATIEKRQADNQSIDAEREALSRLKEEISQLDQAVTANFAAIDQDIREKELPAVIQQRQDEMVANYRQQLDVLLSLLQSIETAGDEKTLKEQLKRTQGHLKDKKHKRSHQPFDPNDLPNRQLQPNKENKPKTTKKLFRQSGLFDTPYQQVAALGDFTYDQLAGADDPAYLAESDEIRLTQAIHDQAELLEYDPVKIFHWVRNNIHWLPSWGAVQAADLTLSSRQGNAFDIASLTIALLRASQIPARYVHGTIDVPEQKFRNWAGDFSDVTAAAEYASSGGIPVTTLISGGVIESIRMEHIWVEAAIDYHPSRGAVNRAADSWVAMDPTYKQYEYLQGLDVIEISGIDAEQLAQDFVDSGTVNEDEGWVTGFDPTILQTAQTQAQSQLETYIQDNLTDPTVGDVIGGRSTIIKEYPVLPSSLPNRIVTEGARYGMIPDSLQYHVILKIFNSSLDQSLDSPSLSHTMPLPRIGLSRLGITYIPSTVDDEAALQAQLDSGNNYLSLYLLSVKPVIKLDETELITGGSIQMGSDQFIDVVLISPTQQQQMHYKNHVAGDEIVVSINGAGTDFNQFIYRSQQFMNDTAAENLHLIGLGYWAQADFMSSAIASGLGVNAFRLPSVGLFSSPLSVTYTFGIPQKGHYIQRNVDIKRSAHAIGIDSAIKRKQYVQQTGMLHSYLEGSILEQLIGNWQGTGLSAMQVLIDANKQNIPIHHITNTNADSILPLLQSIDGDILADVHAALNAGHEVILPESKPVKNIGVSGMGYILLDPETGAGSYRISSGLDGGSGEGPCAEPESRPLIDAIRDILLTIVVLAMLAALVGIVIGGTGGVATPAVAKIMASVGLSALTFSATAGEFCNPIPVPRRGGDSFHNSCADNHPPNEFFGNDVCMSDGNEQKYFDAISNNRSTLWEAKTYNFDNADHSSFLIPLRDKPEWELESRITNNCNFRFFYLVGDSRHAAAIESIQPGFVPIIADGLHVNPTLCLRPSN